MVRESSSVLVFPWRGDKVLGTLHLLLTSRGLDVSNEGIALMIMNSSIEAVSEHLKELADVGPAEPVVLAVTVENKQTEKHDDYLPEELLCKNYASRCLDTEGAWEAAKRISR